MDKWKEHKIEAGIKINFDETPEIEGRVLSLKRQTGKGKDGKPNEYRVLKLQTADEHVLRVNSCTGLDDLFDDIEQERISVGTEVKILYKGFIKTGNGNMMRDFAVYTA